MRYKVLPTKEILFRGRWFHAGQEVELSEVEAKGFRNEIAPAGRPEKAGREKSTTRKSIPKRR